MSGAHVRLLPPPPLPRAYAPLARYRWVPAVLGVLLAVGVVVLLGWTVLAALLVAMLLAAGAVASARLPHWLQAFDARTLAERERGYRDYLQVQRGAVSEALTGELALLAERDPEPGAMVRMIAQRPAHTWRRAPGASDFLIVRAGVGTRPSPVNVEAPTQADPHRPDPLFELAARVAEGARLASDVPVPISLRGPINGLCGEREAAVTTARSLVLQACVEHSPRHLKVVVLCAEAERDRWTWARWLPHVHSPARERWIASDPAAAERALSLAIDAIRSGAHVLVVADEPRLVRDFDVAPGIHWIVLARREADLPSAATCLLDVNAVPNELLDRLDTPTVELAEQVARALAALSSSTSETLFDLLGIATADELDLPRAWRDTRTLSVPLGFTPVGTRVEVDLTRPLTLLGPERSRALDALRECAALLHAVDLVVDASDPERCEVRLAGDGPPAEDDELNDDGVLIVLPGYGRGELWSGTRRAALEFRLPALDAPAEPTIAEVAVDGSRRVLGRPALTQLEALRQYLRRPAATP